MAIQELDGLSQYEVKIKGDGEDITFTRSTSDDQGLAMESALQDAEFAADLGDTAHIVDTTTGKVVGEVHPTSGHGSVRAWPASMTQERFDSIFAEKDPKDLQ